MLTGMAPILLALLVLAAPGMAVHDALLEYRVVGERTLVTYSLSLAGTGLVLSFPIPEDAQAVEAFLDGTKADAVIIGEGRNRRVEVNTGQASSLRLIFITDSYVQAGDVYNFLASFKAPAGIASLEARLKLPDGAFLAELPGQVAAVNPPSGVISTDGRSLTITWEGGLESGESFVAFVRYVPAQQGVPAVFLGLVAVVAIASAAYAVYYRMKGRGKKQIKVEARPAKPVKKARARRGRGPKAAKKEKKPAAEGMAFLLPDEARVVEALRKAPGRALKQKELAVQTGMSKVKVSRVVSRLQARNVVKKYKRGATNIVQLVS
jgi:uncharacterized membrane protein